EVTEAGPQVKSSPNEQKAETPDDAWKAKAAAYQQKADVTDWRWSKDRVSFDYCVAHNLHGHTVPEGEGIRADSASAWATAVFVQIGDVLYVAYYRTLASGCTVVAYDLKERKQLWECRLRAIPNVKHSKYQNSVNIDTDGDAIVVFGNEAE